MCNVYLGHPLCLDELLNFKLRNFVQFVGTNGVEIGVLPWATTTLWLCYQIEDINLLRIHGRHRQQ